jgi:hypothetical protein
VLLPSAHPVPPTAEHVAARVPGGRLDDEGRLLVARERCTIAVEVLPAPGVIAAAELPGLDGYRLHAAPDRERPGDPLSERVDNALRLESDDAELTRALLGDRLRGDLLLLRARGLELVIGGDRVAVLGELRHADPVAAAVGLVAAIAARPAELAARLARQYRRFAGVASGPRWNTVDFQVTLAINPTVRIDWPRRRRADGAPALVTRLRADTAEPPLGFAVVDTRLAPPDPGAMILDVPEVPRGRFALVADPATSLDAAFARLTAALPYLGAALPRYVAVTAGGVEVLFAGLEEQAVAVEPAVTLTRLLAGRPAYAAGPYR